MGESRRQQRLSTDLPPPRQSSTLPRLNTRVGAGGTPALPGKSGPQQRTLSRCGVVGPTISDHLVRALSDVHGGGEGVVEIFFVRGSA